MRTLANHYELIVLLLAIMMSMKKSRLLEIQENHGRKSLQNCILKERRIN